MACQDPKLNPNDCQNFASQCLWIGFGGADPSGIPTHALPMVYNIAGAQDWWCDLTNHSSTWTVVPEFRSMATTNYQLDKIGVQSYENGAVSTARIGDLVLTNSGSHVLVISDYQDINGNGIRERNEFFLCGHTYNRLHQCLDTYDPRYIVILSTYGFKFWN